MQMAGHMTEEMHGADAAEKLAAAMAAFGNLRVIEGGAATTDRVAASNRT